MRIEKHSGYSILCGAILPDNEIAVGQKWQSSSGTVVEVKEINGEWVTYEGEKQPRHTKMIFAFQCRYCLIVGDPELYSKL